MSQGPENTFIGGVHKHLPKEVYRMKNHNEYNGGIADCWYDGSRADLWVEYKFLVVPKRDTTMIDFCEGKDPMISQLQQEWLINREKNGRNVWVIIGCKEGGVLFTRTTQWAIPMPAAAFRSLTVSRQRLADEITRHCRG